jgi:TolB-like protein
MSGVAGLFAELKRRNVFRVGAAYALIAWLLIQAADILLGNFGAPEWVFKSFTALLLLGFPLALVLSWVYELTPEGLKRDADVPAEQSIAPATGQRLDRLILVGLAVLIALVAADRFWLLGPAPPEAGAPAGGVAVASEAGLVAVLPFRNRSVREEDAFFAEGIHDDLLAQLSKIAGLRVISRTSMQRYADSDKSVPEIARELGAAVVLEGAVQRSGDQVRITVQLIDGATDVHLWAETYDRELTAETLFSIQADIARVITDALQVVLTPAEAASLAAGSTRSIEAYDAFLQGTVLSQSDQISAERLTRAIAFFDQAIALDRGYADAHARKARAQLAGYWYSLADPSSREDALRSLEAAQRLAPESTETWLAEAYYHYWGRLDYARAEAALTRVLARSPEHVEAWLARAFVARRDGRFEDAVTAFRRVLEIDPVQIEALYDFTYFLSSLGEFAQAAGTMEQARRLGADTRGPEIFMALNRGDPEAAWAAAVDGVQDVWVTFTYFAARAGRDPQRIALALSPSLWPEELRRPVGNPEAHALAQAEGLLVTGQAAQAQTQLRAIQARLGAPGDQHQGRWAHNVWFWPCMLPGLLGDLEGVRAAEQDYLENSPRDVYASIDIRRELAVAFARAGDPERALDHLEAVAGLSGPNAWLRFSIEPGLDALHGHPRWRALEANYERWAAERGR